MARTGSAPEMDVYSDKVRTLSDGTKRYYRNGMLHRDPHVGPAVEQKDGSGDCYVNGLIVDARYSKGVYFDSEEAMTAAVAQTVNLRERPVPKYLPSVATEKPKNRDHFDKMAGRIRGSSLSDLHKLYDELSSNA